MQIPYIILLVFGFKQTLSGLARMPRCHLPITKHRGLDQRAPTLNQPPRHHPLRPLHYVYATVVLRLIRLLQFKESSFSIISLRLLPFCHFFSTEWCHDSLMLMLMARLWISTPAFPLELPFGAMHAYCLSSSPWLVETVNASSRAPLYPTGDSISSHC